MHFSTLLSVLAVCSLTAQAAHLPPHLRHLVRSPVVQRAGGPISNDTLESMSLAEAATEISASPTDSRIYAASTSATDAAESGKAGDTIAPQVISSSSASSSTTSTDSVTDENTPSPVVQSNDPATISVSPTSSFTPTASAQILNAPSTIVPVSSAIDSMIRVTSQQQRISITTQTHTASATASMANANVDEEKKGGLGKTALIAIIVVASLVGLGAAAVFVIRKWKLRPSGRFDNRLKPISFNPSGNDGMDDVFLEKTLHHRTESTLFADAQRQQFVKELDADPNYVAGIPEHDFTAAANHNHAGYGAMGYNADMYNDDPFARAQEFEYDQNAYYAEQYRDHPQTDYPTQVDYPTQDTEAGYADLHRGNSNGSDHRHRPLSGGYATGRVSPDEFPSADRYIGRPTGGSDGPYAQAAQYRSY